MLQVTVYYTESLTSLTYSRVSRFRETQQTLHFSEVHCYGSSHTESSSNSPDNRAFHSRESWLHPWRVTALGVVWYSNDRMVAGLGLLPGTAPNGAPATCHPVLRILSGPHYSSWTCRVTGQDGTLCVISCWCVVCKIGYTMVVPIGVK